MQSMADRTESHLLQEQEKDVEMEVAHVPRTQKRWSHVAVAALSFLLGMLVSALLMTGAPSKQACPTATSSPAEALLPGTSSATSLREATTAASILPGFGNDESQIEGDGAKAPPMTMVLGETLPEVPFVTRVFHENKTYSERPTDQTDWAWNRLIPPGRGFVYVNDSAEHGLLPGQETESGEIYSVAMFHQLHCLAQIRKAHWVLLDGVATGDDGLARALAGRDGSHIHHCMDYLRQSIMCAGDMSLEWPQQDGPGKGIAVDGWGVPHQCRRWEDIEAYMAVNHFTDSGSGDAAG